MNRDRVGWIIAGLALLLAVPGCTRVEDREGGLFSPFPDGVTGADSAAEADGSMELPPASDFIDDATPPVIVDTGDPPAVVLGDDDSADEDPLEAADGGDAVASGEPPTTADEPPTAAPVEIPTEVVEPATPTPPEPPTPAHVVEVAPVAPTAAQPPAAAGGDTCEAALSVLSPLSDIRLVAAIPDAEPARAIVRFPSGAERVVQIGDLLGSSGAKVVEIKPGSLTLAEVVVNVPGQPVLATHYMHVSR